MISFENDYKEFASTYGEVLNNCYPDADYLFRFASEKEAGLFVDMRDTPFGSNPSVTVAKNSLIVYNQPIIDEFDLSDEEVFACVAHEIGHYLNKGNLDGKEGWEKEIACDCVAEEIGLAFYMATALCKMSDIIDPRNLELRVKALSDKITLYRPEWTCGRYISGKHAALYYNLIDGMSYCFEGISADVVGYIMNRQRNSTISLPKLISRTEEVPKTELFTFIKQLNGLGLISLKENTREEIDAYRGRVSSFRRSQLQSQVPTIERLPVEHSDAENDFSALVGGVSSVMFELTYNCSEKCIHCYNIGATRNNDEISHRGDLKGIKLNDYKRIIDELYELGLFKICLSGGDPFSNPDAWEIIDYLYEKGVAFDIYTNGQRLLGKERCLAERYPRLVGISIYSAESQIHDGITQIPGSLERSVHVARELGRLAVPLNIKCCIMRPNLDSYRTVLNIAEEVGAMIQYEISVTDSVDGDRCVSKYIRLREAELEDVLKDNVVPMQVGPHVPNYGKTERDMDSNACGAGYSSFCITPDGKLIPCCAFHLEFGNLNECSVLDILNNSMPLKAWRKTVLADYTECLQHEYCGYCAICPGLNYSERGDYKLAGENNCYVAKARCRLANKMQGLLDPDNQNGGSAEQFSFSDLHRVFKE